MTHLPKPDSISTLGFAHAPTTKLLMLATGVTSITVSFLSSRHRKLSLLTWPNVCHRRQFWRLLTSQFVIDSSITDLISNCFLTYNFLVLERRWGTAKYISFLCSSWSLSLSLYYAIYKSNLLADFIPNIQTVPSGLYGQLFAMLVYYSIDVTATQERTTLNVPLTSKMFVYLIMLQMMISFDRPEKTLISLCGITAGVLHRMNFLKIQELSRIPGWLRRGAWSLFKSIGLIDDTGEEVSRGVLMGATPEIHDDMVYDYVMKKQQMNARRFQMTPATDDNRAQVGQGYAEVMNPSFGDVLHGGMSQHHQQQPPAPIIPPQHPPSAEVTPAADVAAPTLDTDTVPEEKVKTLMDMGFERDAVLNALASTNNDIQQATVILLSASDE